MKVSERVEALAEAIKNPPKPVKFERPADVMPSAYVSKFYTGHKRFFFSVSVPLEMRERLLVGAAMSEGEAEAAPDVLARYIGRILEKAWEEVPPF